MIKNKKKIQNILFLIKIHAKIFIVNNANKQKRIMR